MCSRDWSSDVCSSDLVAVGTTAADLGVISLVTLLIYAAQPLTTRQALISSALALGGGLLQTALSVALWPVRRYEPERSEEHTSELQSRLHLVCRLLLEKKKDSPHPPLNHCTFPT